MKVILKIGYHEYLLPDDVGVQTVMKVMSKAASIHRDRTYERDNPTIVLDDRETAIEMKYVSAKTKFTMVEHDDPTETEKPIEVKRLKAAPRQLPAARGA